MIVWRWPSVEAQICQKQTTLALDWMIIIIMIIMIITWVDGSINWRSDTCKSKRDNAYNWPSSMFQQIRPNKQVPKSKTWKGTKGDPVVLFSHLAMPSLLPSPGSQHNATWHATSPKNATGHPTPFFCSRTCWDVLGVLKILSRTSNPDSLRFVFDDAASSKASHGPIGNMMQHV